MKRVCIEMLIPIHFVLLKRGSSDRRFLIFRETLREAYSKNIVAKCIKFVTKRGWRMLVVTDVKTGANSTRRTYKTVTMVIMFFSFVLSTPLGKLKCNFLHSERSGECIDFTMMCVFCFCHRLLVQWICFCFHLSAWFLVTNCTYFNLLRGHIVVTYSMTGYTWHLLYSRAFTCCLPFSFLFLKVQLLPYFRKLLF